MNVRLIKYIAFFIFSFISKAYADQYLTDTPVPTPYEVVKLNFASRVHHKEKDTKIRAPVVEAGVGLYPDLQGHFVGFAESSIKPHQTTQYAYGDVRIGLKYRFIHETDTCPQVAFYPKIRLPSGYPSRGIGSTRSIEEFPLWVQKTWGSWRLSGGGGYALNQEPHKKNYGYGGILLRHDFDKALTLGGELFAHGKESPTNRERLMVNVGGSYNFTKKYSLLFSAGRSIAGEKYLVAYLGFGLEI